MRTDSLNLSAQAVAAIKEEIVKDFGEEYLHVRTYKTSSKGAQEAHEAIRPTYFENRNPQLAPQEKRLYDLIWKRAVASQMEDAKIERTVAKISISGCADYMFQAEGEVVVFDGFLRLQGETKDDDNNEPSSSKLPKLTVGELLAVGDITSTQRFVSSVSRFSEASLVKKLEDLGIGRPSTYVPTISTIVQRGYVVKNSIEPKSRVITKFVLNGANIKKSAVTEKYGAEKNKLLPTDIGLIVNDYLAENFVDILDYNFTAKVEKEFDEIADGTIVWNNMIDRFYDKFHVTVNTAMENKNRQSTTRQLGIDPKSGKMVYAKVGKFGPYVQLGENEDECGEKPQYANISNGLLVATITLEEAITLFELPRTLGEFENKVVVVSIGRFGPYIRHDGKFVSLPKTDNPYSVTLERAIELIETKRITDAQRHLKKFDEADNLEIMNGRWGAYIACDGENYKLPKDADIQALSYADCLRIIEEQKNGATPKTKSVKRKTATATAKTAKKATTTRSRKKSETK
jgi:DNA topoisomerase-1